MVQRRGSTLVVMAVMQNSKLKICFVTTVPLTVLWYLAPHIRAQQELFDVTVVADGCLDREIFLDRRKFEFISIGIKRKIFFFQDLMGFFRLWQLFRREQFDIVHSIMPKAGLLAMLAALFAGVPLRFHTFTGQIWVNSKGLRRRFLKLLDRLIVFCSTSVLADSPSQRDFMIEQKIVTPSKIDILNHGSIAGVNIERFKLKTCIRNTIRVRYGIQDGDLVFLYMGRLSIDKGIRDLLMAFEDAALILPRSHLMIIGPDEGGFTQALIEYQKRHFGRVHLHGLTNTPESFMFASDIFCLPSYREGFGGVIIEAAAAGVPSIASRIYGITDAVEDHVTGILFEAGSIVEIREAMILIAKNHELRKSMGVAAKKRAVEKFSEDLIVDGLISYYRRRWYEFMAS